MGTNYYHEKEPLTDFVCHHCGKPLRCESCEGDYRTHIGKSSFGWTFSFHGTEEIRSFADWLRVLESGGRIVDEYGDEHSLDEFKALVIAKHKPYQGTPPLNHAAQALADKWGRMSADQHWIDPEGYSFSSGEFS